MLRAAKIRNIVKLIMHEELYKEVYSNTGQSANCARPFLGFAQND